MKQIKSGFKPNWASPPGHTISDIMRERNISVSELATKIGLNTSDTTKLLNGDLKITINLSLKLSKFVGSSKSFWMRREIQYRKALSNGGQL